MNLKGDIYLSDLDYIILIFM